MGVLVYIKQTFILGRFHATRWGENPPADPFGEWPPSPWRMLRALAAAWFNGGYDNGITGEVIESLLGKLSAVPPSFHLPESARHSGPLKFYQPKGKHAPVLGKNDTTLVEDHFIALPSDEPIWWIWNLAEGKGLTDEEFAALTRLCVRLNYFGRAESLCTLEAVNALPGEIKPNSYVLPSRISSSRPVLCSKADAFEGKPSQDHPLLERTGTMLTERYAKLPKGAEWLFYKLEHPFPPPPSKPKKKTFQYPPGIQHIQFALGGRVWPNDKFISSISERFRGSALKQYAIIVSGNPDARCAPEFVPRYRWSETLSGKHYDGTPCTGHSHAFYLPQLEDAKITRLVLWSPIPLTPEEIEACLRVEKIYWGDGKWPLRVVPLPLKTPLPSYLDRSTQSGIWKTGTPFVPPRFFLRRNGQVKPGQSPLEQLKSLLPNELQSVLVKIEGLEVNAGERVMEHSIRWIGVDDAEPSGNQEERTYKPCKTGSVRVHSKEVATENRRAFYPVKLKFSRPVNLPLPTYGHSSHFGLGLFVPEMETNPDRSGAIPKTIIDKE